MYYGVFNVGLDLVNQLTQSYYDFINEGGASIIFDGRQFIGNDYYTGETIEGLFVTIDQYYSYSPFRIIARNNYNNGYDNGYNESLEPNWIVQGLNVLSRILSIQIFPGITIGTLFAIPIVFEILRMILHIWKN